MKIAGMGLAAVLLLACAAGAESEGGIGSAGYQRDPTRGATRADGGGGNDGGISSGGVCRDMPGILLTKGAWLGGG